MRKIGIITYPRIEDGKGRFLQAYALYSAINKLGYETEIINYLPEEWVQKRTLPQKIRNFLKHPNVWGYLVKLKRRRVSSVNKESIVASKQKYVEFIKQNIAYDLSEHPSKIELSSKKYDAWVCGSDQIWNPHFSVGRDDAYYLQFAPKGKRISYAASMGTLDVNEEMLKKIEAWIKGIDLLSVREADTAKLINDKFNINAKHVCDPTFLMPQDWWDALAGDRIIEEKYLLLFLFDNNPLPRKVAEDIAREKKLKIICMSNDLEDGKKYQVPFGVGPKEFVSLFKYADYVCTQSFHGTVLSLIFNRQFQAFDRSEKGEVSGLILRIKSLLNTYHLEHRIRKNDDYKNEEMDNYIIDYDVVNSIMIEQRGIGIQFLKNSIDTSIQI